MEDGGWRVRDGGLMVGRWWVEGMVMEGRGRENGGQRGKMDDGEWEEGGLRWEDGGWRVGR